MRRWLRLRRRALQRWRCGGDRILGRQRRSHSAQRRLLAGDQRAAKQQRGSRPASDERRAIGRRSRATSPTSTRTGFTRSSICTGLRPGARSRSSSSRCPTRITPRRSGRRWPRRSRANPRSCSTCSTSPTIRPIRGQATTRTRQRQDQLELLGDRHHERPRRRVALLHLGL